MHLVAFPRRASANEKSELAFRFESANTLSDGAGGTRSSYLGTEIDLTVKYNLTKTINLEAGYSYMQATNSMASAQVKNVTTPNLTPQWAYVSLNIKPDFFVKK